MDERRKDYPSILDKLEELERYQTELRLAQNELKILQQKDLDVAEDWRLRFCAKLDKIMGWIEAAPCKERYAECSNRIQSQIVQIKWMWGILTFFVTLEGMFIVALLHHLGN